MSFRIRKWWRGLNEALRGLLLFMFGLLIPIFVNLFAKQGIPWDITSLIILLIVFSLSVIYFAGRSYSRMEQLATNLEVSVQYIEEEYIDETSYKGRIYRTMEDLVSDAKNAIRALVVTRTGDVPHLTAQHRTRTDYLRTLEDIIEHKDNFTYSRIYQVAPDVPEQPLTEYLGAQTSEHVKRVLSLKQKLASSTDSTISVAVLPRQLLISLVLIDDKKAIIDVYGVHRSGASYSRGLFILEDRGGKLMRELLRYFAEAERLAHPITAVDLDRNLPELAT